MSPRLNRLRLRPARCVLATALLQLQCASRCASQLLQAHGPEETEIRLCNASANITSDCVTPNHGLLTALVAILSCLLFLMICSMALPLSAQNRLLRLACSCGRKARHISYIDAGLYKTRNAVCRREVYLRHVWGNCRREQQQQQQQQQQKLLAAEDGAGSSQHEATSTSALDQQHQQPAPQPMVDEPEAVAAACSVPICIEPVQEDEAVADAGEAAESSGQAAGGCWTELRCQHPAVVCDSLYCYRSDPNIRQSSATTRWLGTEEAQRLLP